MAGFLPQYTLPEVRPQNFSIDQPQPGSIAPYNAASVLNSYRQGQTDAGAQQQTNLLKQVGGIAATGGLGAASQAALAGGDVDMGTRLSALDTARKAKVLDIVGQAAEQADTPEKWQSLNTVMTNVFGPGSMQNFEDFKSRDAALMLVKQAKMQLIQTGVPGQPGATQNAAIDLQHPERQPIPIGAPKLPQRSYTFGDIVPGAFGTPAVKGWIPSTPDQPLLDTSGKPVAAADLQAKQSTGLYDDATVDASAEQALAGDKTVFQNLGRSNIGAQNAAKIRTRMYQMGAERGMSPTDIAAATAEFQGYRAGQVALGAAAAKVDRAVLEAKALTPQVTSTSALVSRTNYPDLNAILIAGERKTGDPNVVRFGIAVNSLINVYARAINPNGQPTDSDKAHARELLSTAWSNGQTGAAVDQLNIEMNAALQSTHQARQQLHEEFTGKSPSSTSKGPLPYQPDATKREIGQVYTFPNGSQFLWNGGQSGWEKL